MIKRFWAWLFPHHVECVRSMNRNGTGGCWRVRCNLSHRCFAEHDTDVDLPPNGCRRCLGLGAIEVAINEYVECQVCGGAGFTNAKAGTA